MKWYTLNERFPKYDEKGIFYLKKIVNQWKEYPQFGPGAVHHDSTNDLWLVDMLDSDYSLDVKFIEYWLPFDELQATVPRKKGTQKSTHQL